MQTCFFACLRYLPFSTSWHACCIRHCLPVTCRVTATVADRGLPVKPLAYMMHTAALHMLVHSTLLVASYLKLLLAKACRISPVGRVLAWPVAEYVRLLS